MSITIDDIQSNDDAPDASELPDRHYLIEDIIPECSINILGGPPDAGKTTWLLKAMESFTHGDDILGKRSHTIPIAYWNADRELRDIYETMKRLNIPLNAFPMFADMSENTQFTDIPSKIPPDTRLLIIEAIGIYVADGHINDYSAVGRWFRTARRMCMLHNITIIGTHHTAKAKDKDGYSDPRQRFLGSCSWAGYTDTKMLIEPENSKDVTDTTRKLYIMPKNRPASEHTFTMDGKNGTLLEGATVDSARIQLLLQLPFDTPVTRKQIADEASKLSIADGTLRHYIDRMVASGELISAKKHGGVYGTYIRPRGSELILPGGITKG